MPSQPFLGEWALKEGGENCSEKASQLVGIGEKYETCMGDVVKGFDGSIRFLVLRYLLGVRIWCYATYLVLDDVTMTSLCVCKKNGVSLTPLMT